MTAYVKQDIYNDMPYSNYLFLKIKWPSFNKLFTQLLALTNIMLKYKYAMHTAPNVKSLQLFICCFK